MREKSVRTIVARVVLTLVLGGRVLANDFNPPADYYSTATGSGATLKSQLQSKISSMTGVNYGNARYSPAYTDSDPNAAGKILLVYDRASISSEWDNDNLPWNREHIWPVSRLGVSTPTNTTTNLSSDQFNLRPADTDINAFRANAPFGIDSASGSHGYRGMYYYPGDADAGDVARAQFYMSTRYSQLTLTDSTPSGTQMGDLSALLNFHYRDIPDEFERRRNHTIYGLAGVNSPAIANPYKQSNRNPYVDHPEYVWSVFVNQTNDSSIGIQSGTAGVGGATSLDLNLGRIIVGGALPSNQTVVLNKSGLNGTYYQIATAGSADNIIAGRHNAFRTNTTDTRLLSVGLSTSTNTTSPGLRTGTVTIDNLDVTTGGGAGKGANDGNDVINVSLSVLNHANPSFSGVSDVNSLAYDFGVVTVGGPAPSFSFDIFNYVNPPTTDSFTAGLDLDSIVPSGQASAFNTNLATFDGANTLSAGTASSFTASLNTLTPGVFSATYTLNFSDENLSGAIGLGQMTISLSGQVAAAPAEDADFDVDGDVDGADFLTWQRGVGLTSGALLEDGDADGDAAVDADDLAIWAGQFGAASATTSQTIPEPATMLLAVMTAAWCSLTFCRRKS